MLYIIATPIGHLKDITYRSVETLKSVDGIYCEDTRVSKKLLSAYSIKTPLFSYNEHNAPKVRPSIMNRLKKGESLALISDAGTPLISDPGFKLVQACQEEKLEITSLPGPSACINALALSGMPSDAFTFCGFYQDKHAKLWGPVPSTLIFYEAPHRLIKTLSSLKENFSNRHVCVLREMTKLYEERISGSFDDLLSHFHHHAPKGEIVILLSPPQAKDVCESSIEIFLKNALKASTVKEATQRAHEQYPNVSKKILYHMALTLKKGT
jgi:16S rRNA (cytidine1402-2'-O)-methyltransferase